MKKIRHPFVLVAVVSALVSQVLSQTNNSPATALTATNASEVLSNTLKNVLLSFPWPFMKALHKYNKCYIYSFGINVEQLDSHLRIPNKNQFILAKKL
jgi:hypothetical protein